MIHRYHVILPHYGSWLPNDPHEGHVGQRLRPLTSSFPASSFPASSFPASSFPASSFPASSFPASSFPASLTWSEFAASRQLARFGKTTRHLEQRTLAQLSDEELAMRDAMRRALR